MGAERGSAGSRGAVVPVVGGKNRRSDDLPRSAEAQGVPPCLPVDVVKAPTRELHGHLVYGILATDRVALDSNVMFRR